MHLKKKTIGRPCCLRLPSTMSRQFPPTHPAAEASYSLHDLICRLSLSFSAWLILSGTVDTGPLQPVWELGVVLPSVWWDWTTKCKQSIHTYLVMPQLWSLSMIVGFVITILVISRPDRLLKKNLTKDLFLPTKAFIINKDISSSCDHYK